MSKTRHTVKSSNLILCSWQPGSWWCQRRAQRSAVGPPQRLPAHLWPLQSVRSVHPGPHTVGLVGLLLPQHQGTAAAGSPFFLPLFLQGCPQPRRVVGRSDQGCSLGQRAPAAAAGQHRGREHSMAQLGQCPVCFHLLLAMWFSLGQLRSCICALSCPLSQTFVTY